VGESNSTQVLRDLEISLRTNHIEWVKEFLDEDNRGLDALIDYLSFRLEMMRQEQTVQDLNMDADEKSINSNNNFSNLGSFSPTNVKFSRPGLNDLLNSPNNKRRSRHIIRLNMGATTDDIHVCIMCLRAIMNNKYGFNKVLQHVDAINCITLSLIHKSLRTKALVLELLAAICLVKGGHEIILSAFDNFKKVCSETKRFQTLLDMFINYECFNIDFMVACMQFLNIVVHSVEDINYRVHLQYEMYSLGLDEYLEKLRLNESEELQVQISAYLDNVFDVAALMEDSETKTAALERITELEDALGNAADRLKELEREAAFTIANLQGDIQMLRQERDELQRKQAVFDEEVNKLKNVVKQQEQEYKSRESMLLELENLTKTLPKGTSIADVSNLLAKGGKLADISSTTISQSNKDVDTITINVPSVPVLQAQPAAPPPMPPPAPPKPIPGSAFIPMPPPMMLGAGAGVSGAMTIKRKILSKYKLPTLNWYALKPNQVRGTIFNELDDEKIYKAIDFMDFEEKFKIGMNNLLDQNEIDGLGIGGSKRFKKPDANISILEPTRLRNIGKLVSEIL
jgi:hypothetical protein